MTTPSQEPQDRVIQFRRPSKQHPPTRQRVASVAEDVSQTFFSLALLAEMTAKILRIVSTELGRRSSIGPDDRRHRRLR